MSETLADSMNQVFDGYRQAYRSDSFEETSNAVMNDQQALMNRIKENYRHVKQSAETLDWVSFGNAMNSLGDLIQQIRIEE